jgi:hypothetical protein
MDTGKPPRVEIMSGPNASVRMGYGRKIDKQPFTDHRPLWHIVRTIVYLSHSMSIRPSPAVKPCHSERAKLYKELNGLLDVSKAS